VLKIEQGLKIFLSYSHKDKVVVEKVANLLNEKGFDVWFDEWNIKVGKSLMNEIQKGITSADYVIIFISKNSKKSKWVDLEYRTSLTRQVGKNKLKLLPAKLDSTAVPLFLSDTLYADFSESFSIGFTKLIQAISKSNQISLIDNAFIYLAEIIKNNKQKLSVINREDVLKEFQNRKRSRYLNALDSTTDASIALRPEKFEDDLTHAIRDFQQYLLYESAIIFLETLNVNGGSSFKIFISLLDKLYLDINSYSKTYGLSYTAEWHYLDDLFWIFSDLLGQKIKPPYKNY
jgi:hypothetical protein